MKKCRGTRGRGRRTRMGDAGAAVDVIGTIVSMASRDITQRLSLASATYKPALTKTTGANGIFPRSHGKVSLIQFRFSAGPEQRAPRRRFAMADSIKLTVNRRP